MSCDGQGEFVDQPDGPVFLAVPQSRQPLADGGRPIDRPHTICVWFSLECVRILGPPTAGADLSRLRDDLDIRMCVLG